MCKYLFGIDDDERIEYPLNWAFQEKVISGGIIIDPKVDKIRIAVCTLKGGVGKTTVSANLAGSFAKKGLDVCVVDCDPEQYSLARLFASHAIEGGVDNVEVQGRGIISCYISKCWEENIIKKKIDTKSKDNGTGDIIIYDCPPKLDKVNNCKWNWIFQNADICLIPINICPIGLGKSGLSGKSLEEYSVIYQTIKTIKEVNPNIHILIVENNKMRASQPLKVRQLRENLNQALKNTGERDVLLAEAFIRHSDKIYYWGFEQHELPIDNYVGGISLPDEDFATLSEEILEYAGKNVRNQSPTFQNILSLLKVHSIKSKMPQFELKT